MRLNKHVTAVVTVVAACALAGCSASLNPLGGMSQSDYSRVEYYDSLEDLQAASDAVVVGIVTDQEVVYDIDDVTPFILSTVVVQDTIHGDVPTDSIIVRQAGDSPSQDEEALTPENTYVLYLTESGLSGDKAEHFYVTGVTAGIYTGDVPEQDTSTVEPDLLDEDVLEEATFEQIAPDTPDDIPSDITVEVVETPELADQ